MKKFLNYKFLMSILASVVVLLEVLVNVFKININIEAVISISVACVGILVTLGIITKDKKDKTIENKEDLEELLNNNDNDDNNISIEENSSDEEKNNENDNKVDE